MLLAQPPQLLGDDFPIRPGRRHSSADKPPDLRVSKLIDAIWATFRFYPDDWLGERKATLADGVGHLRSGFLLLFEGIGTTTAAQKSRADAV